MPMTSQTNEGSRITSTTSHNYSQRCQCMHPACTTMRNFHTTILLLARATTAFQSQNTNNWRRITRLQSSSSEMKSLSDQREKISNDDIFFIEVGFGNDSHGQVSRLALDNNVDSVLYAIIYLTKYCSLLNHSHRP